MFALFFKSLRRHLHWWLNALWPGRHAGAPLGARRAVFLFLGYPLFLALQLVHWAGFFCDELIFSKYRKVGFGTPLFILGIPRSGTTFLHRSLAADRDRFTSVNTWEALLAPSICERKVIRAIAALDQRLGAPAGKLCAWLLRRASGDFNEIHALDLNAAEEDYLCLLPAGGCFILLMAFPFAGELQRLGRFDTVQENERNAMIDFYQRALQRHLFCHPGKTLLSKNAAFASWAGPLKSAFPKAKFIVCLREPTSALSSQLSALAPARRAFGSDPDGTATAHLFSQIHAHAYPSLAGFVSESTPEETAVLEQEDLKTAPGATILAAMRQLHVEETPALSKHLESLQPAPTSAHKHSPTNFPVDQDRIRDCMTPAYQSMLGSLHRSHPS